MRDNTPNKKVGEYLKSKRERLNESLAEVSGAVEIDIETLQRIEMGAELPSEDILVLLMSHLCVDETDASKLLRLSGFEENAVAQNTDELARQIFMLAPFNANVLYVDDVEATAGKNGLVLSFTQPTGAGQQITVAKLGLSENVLGKLKEMLYNIDKRNSSPKLLQANNQESHNNDKRRINNK